MTIKDIRKLTGLSQAEFSEKYEIPKRTIEDWEAGVRKPPKYVLKLLERVVIYDYKITVVYGASGGPGSGGMGFPHDIASGGPGSGGSWLPAHRPNAADGGPRRVSCVPDEAKNVEK